MGTIERVLCLGRHVVLVVLRQHFGCAKRPIWTELALRDDAFAFAEQVGKQSGVDDGNRLRGVGHAKAHGQRIGIARETAVFDEAADAKRSTLRRFQSDDLRGCEKEHEIRLNRVQDERGSNAENDDAGADPRETFMTRLHAFMPFLPDRATSASSPAFRAPQASLRRGFDAGAP